MLTPREVQHSKEDARLQVPRIGLLGRHELLARSGEVSSVSIQDAEPGAQVGKARQFDRFLQLVDRLNRHARIGIGMRDVGVHVRNATSGERVESRSGVGVAATDGCVDRPRRLVLAEVVVRDHQVQLRLGVVRIDRDSAFEARFGAGEVTLPVSDEPEHVVDIREAVGSVDHLTQLKFGLLVFAFLEVLPTEQEELFEMVIHDPEHGRKRAGGQGAVGAATFVPLRGPDLAATSRLVASPGRANGPRHVGLVVDPLVLGPGQTEPEVRPGPGEDPVPDVAGVPSTEAPGGERATDTPEDYTPPELLGSVAHAGAEPPVATDAAAENEGSSAPSAEAEGDPVADQPIVGGLRRGGNAVRERLLARARAVQIEPTTSPVAVGGGGLAELDEELTAPSRPIDTELDLVGTHLSRLAKQPLPRIRAGLSPNLVAVIGTLLGLATVASIVALAIHVDPQVALPQLERSALPDQGEESADPDLEAASPAPEEPVVKKRQRKKLPGPWRVLDDQDKPGVRVVKGTIGREAFLRVVQDKGVKKGQAYRLLKAFEGVIDLDKPKRSDQFIALLERASGRLRAFEYIRSKEEVYQAKENDQGYLRGQRLDLKIEHEQYSGGFVIRGSLDESAGVAGFEPGLRGALAKALYGHMAPDFDRGDRLRIVAQEVTVLGEFSRYAGIEALEFIAADGQEKKRIYYFKGVKERGYYDSKGRSPYEGGWRNPVPGAPITSPFGMRMHPVLKKKKLHAGTDFGAPTGTPVHASSFGTVSFVGYAGPAGNVVKIDHPGGIETGYFHLSRFEQGLKVGDKVKRMQVIGYVGSTGRSTGPHLHFSAKKDGKYFDAMTLNLDAMRVIHKSERDAFHKAKDAYDKLLDAIELPKPIQPQVASPKPSDEPELVAVHDEGDSLPAGGSEEPTPVHEAPPPTPAKRSSKPGSVIYLTDKELLEMQPGSDDGEVE